jgi:hypothetical protein
MQRHPRFFFFLIAVPCMTFAVAAQTRSDYIIVSDPSQYTIFNEYQQPLSSAELDLFVPHAPFRIIEKKVTLGDQISQAFKFNYRQKTFYLLMDENGIFIGEKTKANHRFLTGCEDLNDTIEIVKAGLNITGLSGKVLSVKNGERLLRVFKNNGRFCVRSMNAGAPMFGWTSLEPKSSWRTTRTTAGAESGSDTLLPASLKERLIKRMNAANESYKAMFSHFNGLTSDEKSIPLWQYEHTAVSMKCTLTGPYRNTGELTPSTRYLLRDIETTLLGTGFWLKYANGEIVINRNAAEN